MNETFKITRLRLVNFHNVGTTTLDIREGGHLFLLGDNGSGKTTVLDAIHLVLTGGRAMEFNSAARVVGAKAASGRNIQGIVLRYNIETNGPMYPDGGVAYAALEIETRNRRPVSIGVGLGARSIDESYTSWGFIVDGPVDTLPLVHEESGRTRPATRHEFKDALGGRGFFTHISAYTNELAERFFLNRQTYEDVCQLIATGKAYREIAARAGDYDKLFRTLLQEPQKDVFEALIRNLKSIEESRQNLETLRAKVRFVEALAAQRNAVLSHRIDDACARWQERHLAACGFRTEIDHATEFVASEKSRLAELEHNLESLRNAEDRAQLRLTELQQKDAQGLVAREKETRLAHEKAASEHRHARTVLVQAKRVHADASADADHAADALVKQLKSFGGDLQRVARALPFSTSPLAAFFDDAARADTPESAIADMPVADFYVQADTEASAIIRATESAERHADALTQKLAEKAGEIEARQRQQEAVPRIAEFADARRDIREAMLHAAPLYEGLVPASGLRAREVAMLEQLIGDDILATWIASPDAADSLRKLLFKNYPGLSLAVPDENDDTHCEWLGRFFDFTQSDPDAIRVLCQQLVSKAGPRAEKFLDLNILHFRGRETPAALAAPRLIGLEARREQLQREIRELEKERDALLREQKNCTQELTRLQNAQRSIDTFKALLQSAPGALQKLANAVHDARRELSRCQLAAENAVDQLARCEEDELRAAELLDDILLRLKAEGLDGLETRIKDAERKLAAVRREFSNSDREAAVVSNNIKKTTDQMVAWDAQLAVMLRDRDAAETSLLALTTPPDSIDVFVAVRCGDHANSRADLTRFSEDARIAVAECVAAIRNALTQNENLSFGFAHDTAANSLIDRRGVDIDTVIGEIRVQFADQESVINDETRRLFKQIIMDELIGALQKNVMQLTGMTRKIARLLHDRPFGNNRYAFSLSPVEGYGAIIETVRRYQSLAPDETEAELKAFIGAHFDDILSTEVGEIPRALDYRNWFRYELKIMTTNTDGQVIDRKVKGMGSGGEQAVPNYLLILMVANFLFDRDRIRLPLLIFDEAFYGIDANRRDQIIAFASDLRIQLFVASPDQDGVKKEVPHSTSVLVVKDPDYNVHLYPVHWSSAPRQQSLLEPADNDGGSLEFDRETS